MGQNYFGCPSFCNFMNATPEAHAVHVTDTGLSRFFQRYLLQKAISVFKWDIPKQWSQEHFLYTLYCMGYVAIINTDRFGVIPQPCSLYGYDVFYRPTNALVSNPLLRGITSPRIGVECTLIKLQPDYGNIMDLVTFYADMLALSAQTAGVNLFNSKLSYVFGAKNKAFAKSFAEMYDRIASGQPMVVVDKDLFNTDGTPNWQEFQQNVGQNYIADRVLEDMLKWENMFDTDIGIPNANTSKKERLITDEVNANNIETATKCELWLDTVKDGCNVARDMFGIELDTDWRYKPGKEVVKNADSERNVKS